MVSMVGRGLRVGCTVRVPAGNRWHTQMKIIQGRFVYKGVGVYKETQEVAQKPRAIILTQPAGNGCLRAYLCVCTQSLQSSSTLWDPMDCSPSSSSVHGILQTRILERVAVTSCRGSSWPGDGTRLLRLLHWQAGSLPLASLGKSEGNG